MAEGVEKWQPAFPGQRPPTEPGNTLSTRHGAYAVLQLAPRAAEIADGVRALLPVYSPADEPALQTLGIVLARLERASEALDGADDPSDLQRLQADLRGWANTARRFFNDLGMTPTSRAKLGLDLVRARGEVERLSLSLSRLAELAEQPEEAGE